MKRPSPATRASPAAMPTSWLQLGLVERGEVFASLHAGFKDMISEGKYKNEQFFPIGKGSLWEQRI